MLGLVAGNLEFLNMDITDTQRREFLAETENAIEMGERLTRRLLTFASQGTLEPVVINLNEQVVAAAGLLRSGLPGTISLETDLSSTLWQARVDPSEIENTVLNLAINSTDALPGGGKIVIET